VRVVGDDDDVGRALEAVDLQRSLQFAEARILRGKGAPVVVRAGAVGVLGVVGRAEPDQGQVRELLRQDVLREQAHHVLVRRVLRRALGAVGRVAGLYPVGKCEGERSRASGGIAIACGKPDRAGRVGKGRVLREGESGGLQFRSKRLRQHRVLVDEQAAAVQVLDVGSARLAKRQRLEARVLRGLE
jgi:hypothetical protein